MNEKNINSALVRRVNKLLDSRVEHDKVQSVNKRVNHVESLSFAN